MSYPIKIHPYWSTNPGNPGPNRHERRKAKVIPRKQKARDFQNAGQGVKKLKITAAKKRAYKN